MPKALISVWNKEDIEKFAWGLVDLGWDIISSGGTAKALSAAAIPVTDVADITGLGPILGHRVVTLHPAIHGGLLATPDMKDELDKLGYPWIDLVCVDLYPLKEEIAREGATTESVIEKTDIGGPTMLRSAAKGRRIVICDAADRIPVLEWLREGRQEESDFISELVAKVEGVIADYCLASARFHSKHEDSSNRWDGKITYGGLPV